MSGFAMESTHRHCFGLMVLLTVFLYGNGSTAQATSAGFRFLNPPFQLETVGIGSNFVISCATNGTNVTTSLYHRPLWRAWQQITNDNPRVIVNGDVYSIINVELQDGGLYKCKASDGSGQTIKWPRDWGLLIPSRLIQPDVTIYPSHHVVLTEGQSQNFTCKSHGELTTLTWYKTFIKGNVLVPDTKTVTVRDKAKNVIQTLLMITNAQKRDSGFYKCVLQFRGQQRFQFTRLEVYEKLPPKILSHTVSVEVANLQNAKMKCKVEGHPNLKIKWFKGKQEIAVPGCEPSKYLRRCNGLKHTLVLKRFTRNKRYLYRSTLIISKAVYPGDDGVYRCEASNDQGTAKADIFINVLVPPAMVKSPALTIYRRHQKPPFVVSCKAIRGHPSPTFSWEMQLLWGSRTKPHPHFWIPLIFGHTLRSSKDRMSSRVIVPEYMMRSFYRCTATNKIGKDTHLITYRRYY